MTSIISCLEEPQASMFVDDTNLSCIAHGDNKGEFRSRPINAFVDIFALSQSECVIGYYFR